MVIPSFREVVESVNKELHWRNIPPYTEQVIVAQKLFELIIPEVNRLGECCPADGSMGLMDVDEPMGGGRKKRKTRRRNNRLRSKRGCRTRRKR